MKETIIRCDVNTCKKEIAHESKLSDYKMRLGQKIYDLCPSCYQHFIDFIDKRMDGGSLIDLQKLQQPLPSPFYIPSYPEGTNPGDFPNQYTISWTQHDFIGSEEVFPTPLETAKDTGNE